jgi:hypothetical protein
MNKRKKLPSMDVLHVLFRYDTFNGHLYWNPRPAETFIDFIAAKKWNTRYSNKVAGCYVENDGVLITLKPYGTVAAHRIIYKMVTGMEPSHIDHIDGNSFNNRFHNLRSANDAKNAWNMKGHDSTVSGLKGVYYHHNLPTKPWFGSVTKNKKTYSVGYYSSKEAAHEAVCALREELHGEYCRHDSENRSIKPEKKVSKSIYTYIKELLKNKELKHVVHYVDLNRKNKVNSNIVVCPTHAYHELLVQRTNAYEACGHANWIKCTYCKQYDDPMNLYRKKSTATYRPHEGFYRFHKYCHSQFHKRSKKVEE